MLELKKKGYDQNGNCLIKVDPAYFRPTEVSTLLGDATKAQKELGWEAKTSFDEMVEEMVLSDLDEAKKL